MINEIRAGSVTLGGDARSRAGKAAFGAHDLGGADFGTIDRRDNGIVIGYGLPSDIQETGSPQSRRKTSRNNDPYRV